MFVLHFFKSKSTTQKAVSVALAAATGLAVFAASAPAYALTWNWQFATATNTNGSGTYTTDGTIATTGTTYNISSLAGSYFDGTNTYTDLSLDGFASADNTFQWDGSIASPIFADTLGISFSYNSGTAFVNTYWNGGAYGPIDSVTIDGSNKNDSVVSSLLTPASTPVPSPIPVFGATAAFGWSRRLRRKIKNAEGGKIGSVRTFGQC